MAHRRQPNQPSLFGQDGQDGGETRYEIKREVGLKETRLDGSLTSAQTDYQAKAFEDYCADLLRVQRDDRVLLRGRDGAPFQLLVGGEWKSVKPYLIVHPVGVYLIVEPRQPRRWADLYVVGQGTKATGFRVLGWTTHAELTAAPRHNFGYGDKLALPVSQLRPMRTLLFGGDARSD